jgi:RHS repeat-associated protein
MTGRRFDAETGLHYFRSRYYDSIVGRFTARDRAGQWFDMGNLGNGFAFVGNNPWSYTDPFGFSKQTPYERLLDWMVDNESFRNGLLDARDWTAEHWQPMEDWARDPRNAPYLDAFQMGLDIGGMVPGAGEYFDLANASIYQIRGDQVNVALSLAATLPIGGQAATWAKWTRRYGDDVAGAAKGGGLETMGTRPTPGTRVRPEGVPENWRIRSTDTPGGTQYYNPRNPNENVRVMQGNPNSPYPNSQVPYARQQNAGGTYLRQDGTSSPLPRGGRNDPDAHIQLDQFRFRP